MKVQFNSKNENPFYGMENTLKLYQSASKGMAVTNTLLENAWKEANTQDKRAVLFSILFSVGDVSGREHNMFDRKVESGGNSERETFRDDIIPFLVKKLKAFPKRNLFQFMNLVTEYTTMDNILAARVKTKRGSSTYDRTIDMVSVFGIENVAHYASMIILKGTEFQKVCLAKFLTRPRTSKRAGNTQMLPQTKKTMAVRNELLKLVSEKAKLPFEDKKSYTNYFGFFNWRKEFNKDFESVLFSSKKVLELDKEEFFTLLQMTPSDARFRIRTKVMFSENEDKTPKWGKLKAWYTEWELYKENKQAEQRLLETRVANSEATEEDMTKLKKVKKEAKVNIGANSFPNMYKEIVLGTVDNLKVQPFIDTVNLPYNSLVFIDDSGSMNSSWGQNRNLGFTARDFAAFIATIILTKNPDPEARDMVGLFSSECRMFHGISNLNIRPNSIMNGREINIPTRPLIDSEAHFTTNVKNFKRFLDANSTGRGTNVASIGEKLISWVGNDPEKLEAIQRYPVWTLISDGNFNNRYNPMSSIADMLKRVENAFGFRPFIVLIDVAGDTSTDITNFAGLEGVMMVPPNPANIEMLLTNFKDMDSFDIYTPLQSVFRSKRYAPIKGFATSLTQTVTVKETV